MKKLLILVMASLLTTALLNAQTGNKASSLVIPGFVKKQFAKDFVDAGPVTWEKSSIYDKANFTRGGESEHAYYNTKGVLVGTITDKKFDDLPEKARYYITSNYADYNITGVAFYDDNEDEPKGLMIYSQNLDNWDHYFVRLKAKKDGKEIMLKSSLDGDVSLYTKKAD